MWVDIKLSIKISNDTTNLKPRVVIYQTGDNKHGNNRRGPYGDWQILSPWQTRLHVIIQDQTRFLWPASHRALTPSRLDLVAVTRDKVSVAELWTAIM